MSRLTKAILTGLITGIIGLLFSRTPLGLDLEERIGLDLLFRVRGAREVPSDVVIVTLDKVSSEHLNLSEKPEKWPRSLHARLTNKLIEKGASVVAFDMIFEKAQSADHDELFAEAIRNAGNVVLGEFIRREIVALPGSKGAHIETLVRPIPAFAGAAAALAPFPLPKIPVRVSQYWTFKTTAGDAATLPVVVFQLFALDVYPEFIRMLKTVNPAAAGKLPRDREAILSSRKFSDFVRQMRDTLREDPSLSKKAFELLKEPGAAIGSGQRGNLIGSLFQLYLEPDSRYLNYYGPPGTIPTIPYYKVISRRMKPGEDAGETPVDFRNKAVFVGLSERMRLEQKDGFHTVFSQKTGIDISGVEIAATAFANLVENQPIQPLPLFTQLILIFVWGFILGVLCFFLHTAVSAACVIGISVFYLMACQHQFNASGTWLPLVTLTFLQGPAAFFGTIIWKYYDTNRERQIIRKAFGYYLPDKVVDQLARNLGDIKSSNQAAFGTCLFTDAGQYTTLSETMAPEQLSGFMSNYYEALFGPVKQYGGTVINVVGDSMLAVWATANPDAEFRRRACNAALTIHTKMLQFTRSHNDLKLPTRIGLHAGHMMLGSIGAIDHFEYRPIGDIVNTASRMEGLNKYLGTRILVSEEVIQQLDDFLVRELGKFVFVGKSIPIRVYELICLKEDADTENQTLSKTFTDALSAFRKGIWNEAIARFDDTMKFYPQDGPSRFYSKLCRKYIEKPPQSAAEAGETWDGVVYLKEK